MDTKMCHKIQATDMCNKRKLTCCEFTIDRVDFLFSQYCLSKVVNVTVDASPVEFTKYTAKGPVLQVFELNKTYGMIKNASIEICVYLNSPCSCLTKYALFGNSQSSCCNQGIVV